MNAWYLRRGLLLNFNFGNKIISSILIALFLYYYDFWCYFDGYGFGECLFSGFGIPKPKWLYYSEIGISIFTWITILFYIRLFLTKVVLFAYVLLMWFYITKHNFMWETKEIVCLINNIYMSIQLIVLIFARRNDKPKFPYGVLDEIE